MEEDEGIDFQIQALPYGDLNDLVVPIGISTNSSSLRISVADSSLDNFTNVFLEDRIKKLPPNRHKTPQRKIDTALQIKVMFK